MSKKTSKSAQQKQVPGKPSEGKSSKKKLSSSLEGELLEQIELKSKKQKNGCIRWTGFLYKKYIPRLTYNSVIYYVRNLLWNINNPEDFIDTTKYKIVSLCNDDICVKVTHLKRVPKKKESSKENVWKRIKMYGKRVKNEKFDIGCLMWTKDKNYKYGSTSVDGKTCMVHKASYWIHSKYEKLADIPKKSKNGDPLVVRHLCGKSKCYEPTHLKLGTQIKNSGKDKRKHGTLKEGSSNGRATIDEELAIKIKHSKYPRDHKKYKTQKERAIYFNVSLGVITGIDRGTTWSKLKDRNGNNSRNKYKKIRRDNRIKKRKKKIEIWSEEMFKKAKIMLLDNSSLGKNLYGNNINTPCRTYNGNTNEHGYKDISIFGKTIGTHILACEIKNKRHRKLNELTRHLCGNKECCRFSHLKFGTNGDNQKDSLKHGTCHFAKLSTDTVRDIRKTHGNDGLTQIQRAKKYSISVSTIRGIEKYKTWKDVKVDK